MFSDLELTEWEKEDLEDIIANYPAVLEMSDEEIDKLATMFYWKAQSKYAEVVSLENQAETLRRILELRGEQK